MTRRTFMASATGGIVGLGYCGSGRVVASDESNRIRTTGGWKIDQQFGATERRILTKALGIFYARFLQPYRPVQPSGRILEWSYAGTSVTDKHIGHYNEGTDVRDIF